MASVGEIIVTLICGLIGGGLLVMIFIWFYVLKNWDHR